MGLGMKRATLQAIAQAKLDDAQLLLQHRRYSNAYYLAGFAAEIGLKACIAKQISADTIPDKDFVKAIFQHGLKNLVNLAGLSAALREKEATDAKFAANWGLVAAWTPEVRYETVDNYTAQLTLQALLEDPSGVFPWIKTHW
jgi:AbiV family abortive infection protein